MNMLTLIYTLYSFYFIMCWIGFVFVLKMFDYVERQIKEYCIPFIGSTVISVSCVYFLVFDPPDDTTMIDFMLLPTTVIFLCSLIPPIGRGLTEFRRKQKRKRGM